MSVSPFASLTAGTLAGARIWLSGSLPEANVSTAEERKAIIAFVQGFSDHVFQRGGHLVHGSHPSFVPTLLEQARRHQARGGRKDCLGLAVSRYWSKDAGNVALDQWREVAMVYETPEVSGERAREDSLDLLRKWMVSRCDAVVVVGGKWWQSAGGVSPNRQNRQRSPF